MVADLLSTTNDVSYAILQVHPLLKSDLYLAFDIIELSFCLVL